MQARKIKLILFVLLFVNACRLGPDYEQPQFFDNHVLTEKLELKTPAVNTLPFSPQDLKDSVLNHLIHTALTNAPDIKQAKANLSAAREIRLATTAGLFPMLDETANYTYDKQSKNVTPSMTTDFYQKGINISWEIDLFGRTQNKIAAASAQEKQMLFSLENISILLVSEVSLNYINLRTTQQLLEQTKDDLKIQKSLAQLTHEKYNSGLVDAIDVNQADYQLASTQAVIPKLETEIERSQNALAILTGKPAGTLQTELANQKENLITQKFTYPLDKLYTIPVEVLRLRPDVQGMEAALQAQNAQVGLAIANLFPSISLSAFFGLQSTHLHNLFEKDSYAHSFQPHINTSLFHFGALWHQVKAEQANMQALTAEYEKTLLTATGEVRNLLIGLKKMEKRHKDLVIAWEKMDKAAQLARDKYQNGLIDYLQVLDSEERRISAQSAVTSSSGELYQNIINFYKAVGGHFSFNQLQESSNSQ